MLIRLMTINDYDKAMELWNGSAGIGVGPDDTRETFTAFIKRNPKTSFVAFEGERMVGAIMAGHDGYRGFIHHTAVAEDFRHKGIATLLAQKAVDAIKSEGVNKVMMVVFKSNEGGNAFWEAQDFTVRDDLTYRNKRI